jgi:hypothetical protein
VEIANRDPIVEANNVPLNYSLNVPYKLMLQTILPIPKTLPKYANKYDFGKQNVFD